MASDDDNPFLTGVYPSDVPATTSSAPTAEDNPFVTGNYATVPAPAPPPGVAYRGSFLPLSRDIAGHVRFDPSAGIVGAAGRALGDIGGAFTLPGRVVSGETQMPQLGTRDPNAYNQIIPEAVNFGAAFARLLSQSL